MKYQLQELETLVNQAIDDAIINRDNCDGPKKLIYRKIGRLLENALSKVHLAQDMVE